MLLPSSPRPFWLGANYKRRYVSFWKAPSRPQWPTQLISLLLLGTIRRLPVYPPCPFSLEKKKVPLSRPTPRRRPPILVAGLLACSLAHPYPPTRLRPPGTNPHLRLARLPPNHIANLFLLLLLSAAPPSTASHPDLPRSASFASLPSPPLLASFATLFWGLLLLLIYSISSTIFLRAGHIAAVFARTEPRLNRVEPAGFFFLSLAAISSSQHISIAPGFLAHFIASPTREALFD